MVMRDARDVGHPLWWTEDDQANENAYTCAASGISTGKGGVVELKGRPRRTVQLDLPYPSRTGVTPSRRRIVQLRAASPRSSRRPTCPESLARSPRSRVTSPPWTDLDIYQLFTAKRKEP